MEPVFSVENLEFAYEANPGKKILDDVSLALYPGDCLGLMGANGSGKTTLFRCITGLLRPRAGTIRLGGRPLEAEKDFHELRCRVGLVLQDADDQLFFPTVLEDLLFGPLNLGHSEAEAREMARDALRLVGLEGFEERLSFELSGGEKKLVALAAVLAMRPRALLLDEPLNELDEEACRRVANVLRDLPCARLVVSHDRAFLARLCQKTLLLKDGRLLEALP